jgi:sugar transferase (PEP-CTERM/EpsH1 system associated)
LTRDLLFLSHRIPYPPDKGDKIRAWHMFRQLARTHRMHVGCFADDPADHVHIATLRAQCADLHCVQIDRTRQRLLSLARVRPGVPLTLGYFADAGLRAWTAAKLASGIGHAFVYCSAMAPYLMDAAGVRRVLDMVDVDSAKWRDYAARAAWPARLVWAREARTLLGFERRAAAAFDRTLFVSQAEAAEFRRLAPEAGARVGWCDNGVDLDGFSPARNFASPYPEGGRTIAVQDVVFIGTMDYWPNVDAVAWFVAAVLPALRQRCPAARLTIVGANPSPAVRRLARADAVTVTGRVADVRPYLQHAALVVAPLRIARGTQNKVLEAMAMGRPVVASAQAFAGLRAVAGRDLLVADSAPAFADRCADVLGGRHPGLGAAARAAVVAGYDWDATLAGLDALLDGAPPLSALAGALP